jgi:hypothetical protein
LKQLDHLDHVERGAHGGQVAASASGSGAPKSAISPSPIIWLTTPPGR